MGIVRQADRLSGRKVGGLSGNLSAKPVEGGFGKHVVPPFKNGQTYFAGLFSEQDGMGPIGGIAFFGGQMGGDLLICLDEGNIRFRDPVFRRGLVEIVELPDHPYFIACQFHPEFKSRPQNAHPLFDGLIAAALQSK